MSRKRNFKKMASILMAMAMVVSVMFATTATTFAAENATVSVTVEFAYDDVYLYDTVNYNTNTFTRTQYTIPTNPGTAVITSNTPTVMDATLDALDAVAPSQEVIMGWDTVDTRGGAYITKMIGQQTVTAADSSATVWKGYAWKYLINGEEADLYATNIALENGDVITWIYDYCTEPID